MSPDKLIILEPRAAGHRMWYVRLIAEYCGDSIPVEVCTTTATTQSEQWRTFLGSRAIRVHTSQSEAETVRRALELTRDPSAYLLVLEADRFLRALFGEATSRPRGMMRGTALIMRTRPSLQVRSLSAMFVKLMCVACIRALQPRFRLGYLRDTARPGVLQRALRLLGIDPVDDPLELHEPLLPRDEWLAHHGIDPGQIVYLIAGDVSERKHVIEIVDAWQEVAPAGACLVLLGTPSEGVRTRTARRMQGVHTMYEFVSDEQMDTWIRHSDYVLTLHRNEGASGILAKRAAAGGVAVVGGARSVVQQARDLGAAAVVIRPTPTGIRTFLSRQLTLEPHPRLPWCPPATRGADFASQLVDTRETE